jgi:sulfide dehydrogenase [flavocytochrome c] flavoprotein chain
LLSFHLYLGGFKPFEAITHTYEKLASAYGIKLNHQIAAAIDRDKKQVRLADGSTLAYDRLVVAPGIDSAFPAGAGSTRRSCHTPGRPESRPNS